MIDADELIDFPYSEGAGTEEQIEDWIEECDLSNEKDKAKMLCWKVIEGFQNVVKTAPTISPLNEPLTPEELREMVDQPVWTVGISYTDDGKWAMWDIIESVDKDGITFGYSTESREWWNYNLRDERGNLLGCAWTCYRQPPKEVLQDG